MDIFQGIILRAFVCHVSIFDFCPTAAAATCLRLCKNQRVSPNQNVTCFSSAFLLSDLCYTDTVEHEDLQRVLYASRCASPLNLKIERLCDC